MGKAAERDNSRSIALFKNGIEYYNNTSYEPGDVFIVKLRKPTVQTVFEVTQTGPNECKAQFINGGCGGRRSTISRSDVELQTPSENNCVISIVAGWSVDYADGVKVSDSFILLPKSSDSNEL
jgi:hypothetical protein